MGERSAAASTTDRISGWVKAAKDIIVPYKKKKKKEQNVANTLKKMPHKL